MTEQVTEVAVDQTADQASPEPAIAPSASMSVVTATVAAAAAPAAAKPKKKSRGRQPAGAADRRPAMKIDGVKPKARQRPSDQGRKSDDGKPSGRAQARENMRNFRPEASHPYEPVRLSLVSEYTRKLFTDHCGRAQISLYNLMHYLPIRLGQLGLRDERSLDTLDALEELIDNRIEDIGKRMRADYARYKKVLQDNQLAAVKVYSQPPLEAEMPRLTPQIGAILNLLTLFDEYISTVEGMYTNGYMRRRAREEAINQYRNEIVTLIRHLMRLYQDCKELLTEGSSAALAKLLSERDDSSLPERLDDEDEAAAREMTAQKQAVEGDIERP